MPNTFCLLNHELTQKQTAELHASFGSDRIIYPPNWIATLWSSITTDRELVKARIEPFITWLQEARKGDLAVIQGEFGATFALVDFSLRKGLIPLYAVTKRVAQETRKDETVYRSYVFEHVCFRPYRYYQDLLEEVL